MDVNKTRQKYKHFTSLCFSIMGQRRFRISMGALIASPEAGDASSNVMPRMKNCPLISNADRSKYFVSSTSERGVINRSSLISVTNLNSVSSTDEDFYNRMISVESNALANNDSTLKLDNCCFPYYRSSKSSGGFPDAVLVKDVGISCTLSNEHGNSHDVSISAIENYLMKQLKREYNDLANITNKISSYTKDIINHLSRKDRRKNRPVEKLVSSNRVLATQYMDDKGNLCLKLRLLAEAATQYSPRQIAAKSGNAKSHRRCAAEELHSDLEQIEFQKQRISQNKNSRTRHERCIQTTFVKGKEETINSTKCSATSICDYLTMKKKKSSNEMFKHVLSCSTCLKTEQKSDKHCSNSKEEKTILRKYSPVIFTNWREISKAKRQRKKMSGSSDERLTIKEIDASQDTNTNFPSQQRLNDCNTKFHTVNIRIVNQKRRNK